MRSPGGAWAFLAGQPWLPWLAQVAIDNVKTAAAEASQASDKRKINEYISAARRAGKVCLFNSPWLDEDAGESMVNGGESMVSLLSFFLESEKGGSSWLMVENHALK